LGGRETIRLLYEAKLRLGATLPLRYHNWGQGCSSNSATILNTSRLFHRLGSGPSTRWLKWVADVCYKMVTRFDEAGTA